MDYDELVRDIVKQVHVRYEDYVDYQKSEGLDVEPFEAIAEQTCDDTSALFYNGNATFDGTTPYEAFWNDCYNKLNVQ